MGGDILNLLKIQVEQSASATFFAFLLCSFDAGALRL